jgi:hypothetical protein
MEGRFYDTVNHFFTFGTLTITTQNTGRTPAIGVVRECCIVLRRPFFAERIYPDYDTEYAEFQKMSEQKKPVTGEEAHYRPSIIQANGSVTFSPAGPGVYPPQTAFEEVIGEGSIWLGYPENVGHLPPAIDYVLGKITYHDIFTKRLHTTTVCLTRMPASLFLWSVPLAPEWIKADDRTVVCQPA